MVNIVVDTSVLIEEVRRGSELWQEIKEESKKGSVKMICPSIVLTELWAGSSMEKAKAVEIVERMMETVTVIDVGQDLAKKAGEIIRNHKLSGFDAIIAATCAVYDGKLATLNTKHFVGIKGLKLYNHSK